MNKNGEFLVILVSLVASVGATLLVLLGLELLGRFLSGGRRGLFVAIGLVGLSYAGCRMNFKETEGTDLFTRMAQSSVVIDTEDQAGSGTIIYSKHEYSLILTCAHVIEGQHEFKVMVMDHGTTSTFAGYLERIDNDRDLALLFVKADHPLTTLQIATVEPQLYERLYTVASPLMLHRTASDTILESKDISINFRHHKVWRTLGFTLPGASGGTIANSQGELVCVPEAGHIHHDEPLAQIGYCIPLQDIRNFVAPYKIEG